MARKKWAVCPPVEESYAARVPELFPSKLAAKRFLNRPAVIAGEVPPALARLSVEERSAIEVKRRADLERRRTEAANIRIRSRSGDYFASHPDPRPILNHDRGWQKPVPVVRLADYLGSECKHTVRELLGVDAVDPASTFSLEEELKGLFLGNSGDFVCCLEKDWRFDEIDADTWRRSGHEYSGWGRANVGEIVVRAIYDLDAAFEKFHPNPSCSAVAQFWQSWQVQRHIAGFCARLAEDPDVRKRAGKQFRAADQAERARVLAYRQLAVFAHVVLGGAVVDTAQGSADKPANAPPILLEATQTAPAIQAAVANAGNVHASDKQGQPLLTERAAWLAKCLQERSWNKHDVSRNRGPNHKTVQKILDGKKVREDVLARLAEALSAARVTEDLPDPKVALRDIPSS